MSKKIIQFQHCVINESDWMFLLYDDGTLLDTAIHSIPKPVPSIANPVADEDSPHKIFTPKVYIDGNKWCAIYGENLQEGVCGFGNTPAEAVRAFDAAWVGDEKEEPNSNSICPAPELLGALGKIANLSIRTNGEAEIPEVKEQEQ